jgi:hypothetical protein
MVIMKTCKMCKQGFPKTLEYFYKHGKYLQSACRECAKARSRANRLANPKKIRAIERASYAANPEKAKARKKAYYKANPKKVKAIVKAWAKANLEKKKANDKAWKKANPEKEKAYANRRRARKLGNGFEPYTHEEIFKTYGTNCYLCDMPINLQVSGKPGSNPQWRSGLNIEHFIDIALGGSDTIENVRPSHAWCNLTKGSK